MSSIEILVNKENILEIKIRDEGYTLLNLLVDELNKNTHVKYAAYTVEHPLEKKIKMIVMTDGEITPLEAIREATKEIKKKIERLREQIREQMS